MADSHPKTGMSAYYQGARDALSALAADLERIPDEVMPDVRQEWAAKFPARYSRRKREEIVDSLEQGARAIFKAVVDIIRERLDAEDPAERIL